MKQIFCVFLISCLVLPLISSCSNGTTTLRGWVFNAAPFADAYLSVLDTNGNVIFDSEEPVTGDSGVFLCTVTKKIPDDFRVVFSIPESPKDQLTADIRGYDPVNDVINVNLLTTIVSHYLDVHPEVTVEEAEIAIKLFFEIPPYIDIDASISGYSDYFSPSVFMVKAAGNDGIDNYITSLVEVMAGTTTTLSMKSSGLMLGSGQSGIPTTGMLDSLLNGAASAAGEKLMGWGLGMIGLKPPADATATALKEIQQTLTEIKQSIDKLENDLKNFEMKFEKEIARTQYLVMMDYISSEIKTIKGLHGRLSTLVATMNADAAVSGDITWSKGQLREKESIVSQIDPLITTCSAIHDLLVGNVPGFEPLINVWSRVYGTKHRFLSSDNYEEITSWYSCFEQYQVYLAELIVEYYHAEEYEEPTISNYIKQVQQQIARQKTLLPSAVPEGLFVDTQTGKMWFRTPLYNCSGAQYILGGQVGQNTNQYWNDISVPNDALAALGGPLWFVYGSFQNPDDMNLPVYQVDTPVPSSPMNTSIDFSVWWSHYNGYPDLPAQYYNHLSRNKGFDNWLLPEMSDLNDLMGDYRGNNATEEWFVHQGAFPAGSTVESVWGNSGGNVWTGEYYWAKWLARCAANLKCIGGSGVETVVAVEKEGAAQMGSVLPYRHIVDKEYYYAK